MKIGVLGSGTVGRVLGTGFLRNGNEVMLGTLDPNKPEVQHVVTAFNSVGAARMVNPQFRQGPPTMFLCGDSAPYRAQVSRTHAFKLLVE